MNTLGNPTLYKKRVYRGIVYIIFLILSHRGGSNEHPQSTLGAKIRKISQIINLKNDIPRAFQGSIILHRCVILMVVFVDG